MHRLLTLVSFSTLAVTTAFADPENPLATSPSAFIRAHADSPVHWMTWGDAAFARAAKESKPVFVSVGNVTNELSRAMRTQSFARPEIAAVLNDDFICVLVDRDERPDIAALYQTYVRSVKQLGGWPLNVWLTPELKPFDGATYLPPSEEWGKEGFVNAIKRIDAAWKTDPAAQRGKADDAVNTIVAAEKLPAPPEFTDAEFTKLLSDAAETWRTRFDADHPGFSDPPRYLDPELHRFLLHADTASRDQAVATLRAIAAGAVRDPLDGGFFRYSTDAARKLPYYQRSSIDQARMALAYLDAAEVTKDPEFTLIARGALDFALATLARPDGSFAQTEDGTPEGTAAYFAWTADEIHTALGDETAAFEKAYNVKTEGNVSPDDDPDGHMKGLNILAGSDVSDARLAASRAKLLALRHARKVAPVLDETVASAAQGWMLQALVRAGVQCNEPRYLGAARRCAAFIREKLVMNGDMLRSIAGSDAAAGPADYASVARGLLDLQSATPKSDWHDLADRLTKKLNSLFFDATSGRFFSSPETPAGPYLWARVHVAAAGTGEPPSVEAMTATANPLTRRAIALDVRDATDAPHGDLVLALQSSATK